MSDVLPPILLPGPDTNDFRSIQNTDIDISQQTSFFIEAWQSLTPVWGKMSGLLGKKPSFVKNEISTTLTNNEVIISSISNPNVKLMSQTSEQVQFKSLTGKDESFSFDIKADKQGFTMQKTVTAKVTADIDSSGLYEASAVGLYNVTNVKGNPTSKLTCQFKADGTAIYTIYNDPSWADGTTFNEAWILIKIDRKYYITTSFTNPGYQIEEAKPVSYPVSSFIYRETYTK